MKTDYADTLNALDTMQGTLLYSLRRSVLADAERAIVKLERQRNAAALALEACITDSPYQGGVGAPNRVGTINRIACDALRAIGINPGKPKTALELRADPELPTVEGLLELIDRRCDQAFSCGEWNKHDSEQPYSALAQRGEELDRELRAYLERMFERLATCER